MSEKTPELRLAPGSEWTADELRRFRDGTNVRLHDRLGARPATVAGSDGVAFAVWAPNARRVSVIGDFNGWGPGRDALRPLGSSGVWAGFVPGVGCGALYKYRIESRLDGYEVSKADPFAFRCQHPPDTASVVWELDYDWSDAGWMSRRSAPGALAAPIAIYEVHLGSWKRRDDDPGRMLGYRELADELVPYVEELGFTHVEILPPKEHPFYGSWGYQTTAYFAPTVRYGTPQDLMHLIDRLHEHGIGVILDWVPSHFPTDEHGPGFFDGTHLYEHADPKLGYHPDWKSFIFNYDRGPVRSFLLSSALFWLERYHADGLRVDAVASMLYRDYSRKEGEWIPNEHGGRENLAAIELLRRLNIEVHERHPGAVTIAEESTTWPMVSRPVWTGGLGFDMKWDMGWMHDTLAYLALDPVHRKFHHHRLTFRMVYAFAENFVLPLSHDEVVHGKGSLLGRMPGDLWQKFANLRALLGYMYAQPGKKLLFMGAELGSWREWDHERGLEWNLADLPFHGGLKTWVRDLNRTYREHAALHRLDFSPAGFEWIDCADGDQSVIVFLRRAASKDDAPPVLAVCNFTPVVRSNYRVGVPSGGTWSEILNSDAECYGGSGQGNLGGVEAVAMSYHDRPHSILVTLPALSLLLFQPKPARALGT